MAKILDFKANNTTLGTGSLTNVVGADWAVVRNSEAYTLESPTTLSKQGVNVPRIQDGKVLIEIESTNSLLHSNDLADVAWTKAGGTGTNNGTTTAPDGSTVDWFELNDGVVYQDITIAQQQNVPSSIWIKGDQATTIGLRMPLSSLPSEDFDVTTEWQRYDYVDLGTNATVFRTLIDNRATEGYGTVTPLKIAIFSAQIETPSSIITSSEIVTTIGVATREADVITNTVPVGTAPFTMTTWIDGVSDGGVAVNQGDPITMLNGTTSIEIDDSAGGTTTVEVEWIDSISAAATGNKIYRDDVEIADVANGIQIYQDATAETGTEYKYEVQAYSATDETTQEVLGVNVQFITTS